MPAPPGHVHVVDLLLSKGMSLEETDPSGWTPLVWATKQGSDLGMGSIPRGIRWKKSWWFQMLNNFMMFLWCWSVFLFVVAFCGLGLTQQFESCLTLKGYPCISWGSSPVIHHFNSSPNQYFTHHLSSFSPPHPMFHACFIPFFIPCSSHVHHIFIPFFIPCFIHVHPFSYIFPHMSGWWFGTFFDPYTVLGISSSQLTFIFFRGVRIPPTIDDG